jgi:hypothetical protein
MTIKANFDIGIIPCSKTDDQKLEELLLKLGASGSHMIFRSDNEDEELFLEEL